MTVISKQNVCLQLTLKGRWDLPERRLRMWNMPSHSKSRKWALKKFPCEFAIPSHLDSGTLCAVIGPSRTDRIGQGDNPDVAIVLSVIHPYSVVSLNVPPIAICAPLFVASTFQNNLLQRRRTRIGSLRAVWEFEEILRPRREGIEPIARHVATLMTKHQVPQMSAHTQPARNTSSICHVRNSVFGLSTSRSGRAITDLSRS